MATVKVRFFATFREVTGCLEASVEASDVSELLEHLVARFGEGFGRLVHDGSSDETVIMVNGRNMSQLQGPRTALADGDEVALFPPISGG